MVYEIQVRHGSPAEWTAANPVLLAGELAAEIDVDGSTQFKVGNGTDAWNDLPYAGAGTVATSGMTVESKSTTSTITLPNDKLILCDATAGAITINLPTAAGIEGTTVIIKKIDASANTVTADPIGAETVDGYTTLIIEFQYTSISLTSDGTNWARR